MIRLKNIGYQFVNVGGFDLHRDHGSGDYLFLFFRCDTEVFLDGHYRLIPANTFFLYEKGIPQIYRKLDGHFINDWMHFDFDQYDQYFEKLGIPFQTPITLPNSKIITDRISDLFIEFFNIGDQHEVIIDQLINVMFHQFSDLYRMMRSDNEKKKSHIGKFIEIRRRIQSYELLDKNSESLAQDMNMSKSYFQHLYREFFNSSVGQDLINARIDYACHLLHSTELSIRDISERCGYSNLEHFSRQFKKIKHISPSSFRHHN